MPTAARRDDAPPLSVAQSREVDRRAVAELGISSLVLMENAGRAVVEVLERLGVAGPVAIACGRGNNGGDGLVIARHLEIRGHEARVLVSNRPEEFSPDARANYEILRRLGAPMIELPTKYDAGPLQAVLAGCDWIVDALLGSGTRGAPRPPLDRVLVALNAASAKRLAVDLPSGLDADTGEPAAEVFRADYTCTMVAPKLGFANPAAAACLGQVHVVDIGLPPRFVWRVLGGVT